MVAPKEQGRRWGTSRGSSREVFSNTQACERAIEREEKDMARGWSHGTGTTWRGLRKPISSVHACVSSEILENGLHSCYRPHTFRTYPSKKPPKSTSQKKNLDLDCEVGSTVQDTSNPEPHKLSICDTPLPFLTHPPPFLAQPPHVFNTHLPRSQHAFRLFSTRPSAVPNTPFGCSRHV